MSARKYYVICEDNCKFESMTKEQIIAAIEQAIATGKITDVDAGFITKVKEQNAGKALYFWLGTTAEYNAIPEADRIEDCLYIKTDDTFEADVVQTLLEFEEALYGSIAKIPPQAEITVNAIRGGQFTCVDEYGNSIEPQKRDETKWVFSVPKYGTYTITGVYNNITRTEAVTVDAVKQYETSIQFYDDIFSNNDIDTIVDVINGVGVPDTWNVGDVVSLPYTDGSAITGMRIIGKAHDTDTDGAKTKVTFAIFGLDSSMINPTDNYNHNDGGWENSYMRTVNVPATMEKLPEKLKNAIRTVQKRTSAGDMLNTILVSYDKLFLLSEVELTGTAGNSFEGEGTQYEYFKNGNNMYGTSGNDINISWAWLRSPSKNNNASYIQYKHAKSGCGVFEADASISADSYFGFCL